MKTDELFCHRQSKSTAVWFLISSSGAGQTRIGKQASGTDTDYKKLFIKCLTLYLHI